MLIVFSFHGMAPLKDEVLQYTMLIVSSFHGMAPLKDVAGPLNLTTEE
jgi:hypothetical protein